MPISISGQQLQLADLQLLPDLRAVRSLDGREVFLRRKEFQLFHFLANNLDDVISKFALLELVWNFESFVGSNTLEVHLSGLRKKLGQLSRRLHIETIRGVGYRLTTTSL